MTEPVSELAIYAERLDESTQRSQQASLLHHQYLNGDAQTDVNTDSGAVPSIAKQARLHSEAIPDAVYELSSQMADGKVYATKELGLASATVQPGMLFWAASLDSLVIRTLWKKINATTAEKIGDEASAKKVIELSDGVALVRKKTENVSEKKFPDTGFLVRDGKGGKCFWTDSVGVSHSLASATRRHIVGGIEQIPQTFRRILGTVWAYLGSDGKALVALRDNGQIDVAKLNAHELLVAGKPFVAGESVAPTNLNDMYMRDGELLKYHANPFSVSGWGSSSMERMGSQFAAMVGALEPNATYYNGGKGGEQSTHIAARLGSIPMRVTVANGVIPASGSVAVTASNARPTGSLKPYTGWLNGVHGTISSTGSVISFTRTVAGDSIATVGEFEFAPEIGPQHRSDVVFLWMGKNDVGVYTAEEVIERTDKSFKWLSALIPRCLVIGHFPNSNWDPASTETKRVLAINAAHKARYGDLYIDVQALLQSSEVWALTGITPTAQDLQQQALGQKPTSLSVDDGHMNEAMYIALNEHVIQPRIRQLGWY